MPLCFHREYFLADLSYTKWTFSNCAPYYLRINLKKKSFCTERGLCIMSPIICSYLLQKGISLRSVWTGGTIKTTRNAFNVHTGM